jgi:omega-hydroxy-beta-dihydromenaquinone-9 sulfotransferase
MGATSRLPWRERLGIVFGPGVLAGVTLGDWLKLLAVNRFCVHPLCLPRAMSITSYALMNSAAGWFEQLRYGSHIKKAEIAPPLFVLGHWRSGTTLLHDLLALDHRFACPNLYEVMYPHTFLTTEKSGAAFLRALSPKSRPQDNMKLDPATAWEDEFGLCASGFRSPYLTWAFPNRMAHYDRFLTFRHATAAETEQWRAALMAFLKKLTFKHRKPLILKSPTHTARVKLLLEMFPEARFVHIHRDPYTVYRSAIHMHEKAVPFVRLQRPRQLDWAERVIRQYKEMHEAFFEERRLIPAGHFCEVRFESLEKDPVTEMRNVYGALGLPAFSEVEPDLRAYVASLSGYRKNAYADLPDETRRRVALEWRRCFEEWDYPL